MKNNKELSWKDKYEREFGTPLQMGERVNPGELKQFIRETLATEKKALLNKYRKEVTREYKATTDEHLRIVWVWLDEKLKEMEKRG